MKDDPIRDLVVTRACEYRDQIKVKQTAPPDKVSGERDKEKLARKRLIHAVDMYQNRGGDK